ncbi:site-specific recombinase XerD [Nitrosomonas ureae]|uniref:site-specific integrase n=1 Tax=Nitrosomonas ureae TaxID=44577 RepID=UPI000D770F69|nr:site-specific integrase [Nitrosomonas ureae]PXX09501.1 site-specific recombinase XerD [Nitrosomonas ureae]
MITKLTESIIKNGLHCPEDKSRIEFCDSELPGLYVEVRATSQGQGTYYLRYKDSTGKTCHQKIGRTTDITLVEARKRAKTLKAEIALGSDPRRDEKAMKAVLTFSDFFENHYLPYVKPRKRSWKRDDELYRLRIKAVFGHKRLNEITRQQIQLFHTALMHEGLAAATCNHHIKLLKHALNLAIDWEMLQTNPASRIPLFHEDNKVENYLEQHELERLLNVLRTDDNRSVCFIAMFLLSTAARLNEVLRATWSQIDQHTRVWRIPASNSKSKRVRAVPLNDSAIEVLSQLDTEGKFEYLFINAKTKLPYVTIHKVWERLRKKAGLSHIRLHDIRHLHASLLVNSGRTLYEVQQILGHSSPSVTQRYAHLSTKSLQEASNSASVKIKEAMIKSM